MKIWRSFWKKNVVWIVLLLLLVGFHMIYMFLTGIPFSEIGYAGVLEVALIVLVTGGLFAGYYRKIRYLEQGKEALLSGQYEFPEARDMQEDLYQQMVEMEDIARKLTESSAAQYQAEMKDYYACWVHQIKTPIAALQLLLQTQRNEVAETIETDFEDSGREALASLPDAAEVKKIEAQKQEIWYQQQNQKLSDMEEELFRIEQYVGMALQYQRLSSEANDFVLEWIDLDKMIRSEIRKYARTMIRRKIRMNYAGCEQSVLTDKKWIAFVIGQIFSNAVKYTPEGEIAVSVHQQGIWCYLKIQETGIGIQPEDIPRVFERGYTGFNGHGDTKSTGIGLYLCQKALKKLGHTIRLESEPGVGTAVWIGFQQKAGDHRD